MQWELKDDEHMNKHSITNHHKPRYFFEIKKTEKFTRYKEENQTILMQLLMLLF